MKFGYTIQIVAYVRAKEGSLVELCSPMSG